MSGRPVKIRVSYADDAAFLSRLSGAIERDPKRSDEWKKEACAALQKLCMLFMEPITGHATPPLVDIPLIPPSEN